jgi:hypothetical protein
MNKTNLLFGLLASFLFSGNAAAVSYGGVEFPDGPASFADFVVDYSPVIGGGGPTAPYQNPDTALGIPDDLSGTSGGSGFVTLGSGGSLTLQFTDNSLTGSGNSDDDLWIFEVGPDVEDTFVEISKDNLTWFSVGKVFGSIAGVDIDAFGFGVLDFFSYVRLTDDPNEGDTTGITVGADIDAVGAISSAPPVNPVPVPAAVWLFGSALLGLAGAARRRKLA